MSSDYLSEALSGFPVIGKVNGLIWSEKVGEFCLWSGNSYV